MRYNGSLHLLVTAQPKQVTIASEEALPEIAPGAFAAWARAARERDARQPVAGEPCLTPDGRRGHVVEIIENGHRTVVCQRA
jgi:hypothetical protein